MIRAWSDALRRGNLVLAARYFALPSEMINGGGAGAQVFVIKIRTLQQAVYANATLPCGARFVSADRRGPYVNALFRLTGRHGPGGSTCAGGVGTTARTNFVIRGGRIVEWIRAPSDPGDNGTPAQPTPNTPTVGNSPPSPDLPLAAQMSSVPPHAALVPQSDPPAPVDQGPPDIQEPRWPLWMAPAAILLGFAIGLVLTIIVQLIGHSAGSSLSHPTPAVSIASDIVFDLGFVVSALYFGKLAGVGPAGFGFRRIPWKVGVKAFLVAGVGYFIVTAVYASLLALHGKDKLPSELGVTKSTAALIAATVFVCVVAPIAEELFFRGFLFGVLRRWRISVAGRQLGPWIAAVVVGILFGLAHTGSASSQYLVPLGFLGFVLCLVRWRTGSLYPCMALHSVNNSLALAVNQLHWSAAGIVGLMIGSLLVIGAVTGPLSAPRTRASLAP